MTICAYLRENYSVILRSPADRRTTKNLITNSASFCHSEEFADRRMTKNLKTNYSFLRDSSSPSASQNDNSIFPVILRNSSFRFASFRMTFSVSFVRICALFYHLIEMNLDLQFFTKYCFVLQLW